jgi:hypothetical protein
VVKQRGYLLVYQKQLGRVAAPKQREAQTKMLSGIDLLVQRVRGPKETETRLQLLKKQVAGWPNKGRWSTPGSKM